MASAHFSADRKLSIIGEMFAIGVIELAASWRPGALPNLRSVGGVNQRYRLAVDGAHFEGEAVEILDAA